MQVHHSNKSKYDDLVDLARTCAFQARVTKAKDVACELRRMAKEYQKRAADFGEMPQIEDIGE